jgi:hypothetical protein
MSDPRPCHGCRRDVELAGSIYAVLIDARTLEPRIEARFCPRCARAEFRRRRAGPIDEPARRDAAALLGRTFGAAVRVIWLQGDERRWAVLARRRDGRRATTGEALFSGPT